MTHKFVVVDDVSQQQFIVAFIEEIKNTRDLQTFFYIAFTCLLKDKSLYEDNATTNTFIKELKFQAKAILTGYYKPYFL